MERNTITVALPRLTEITRVSVTVMAKGQALLLSHNMKIISSYLILLNLHKVYVFEHYKWKHHLILYLDYF